MKDRKKFKLLFQSDKMVHVDKVYQEFGFSSEEKLAKALSEWKLEEYFDITGTFVRRNEKPTRLETLKKKNTLTGLLWVLTGTGVV